MMMTSVTGSKWEMRALFIVWGKNRAPRISSQYNTIPRFFITGCFFGVSDVVGFHFLGNKVTIRK